MPSWTDDEGNDWFNRCMECCAMKDAHGDCTNRKCINFGRREREEKDAMEYFMRPHYFGLLGSSSLDIDDDEDF